MTQEEEYARFTVQRVGRRPDVLEDASVHEVIASLGETPEQVVDTLRKENCHGPRMNDCFCPVAQYIAKKTGRAASATPAVCVVGDFTFYEGHIDTFVGREWARTTPAVAEVITAIDHGLYSDLDEPAKGLYDPDRGD